MDEQTILNSWSWMPHTLAQKCSNGRWKPYKHLVYLAERLTQMVAQGNARIIVCMHPRVGKSEFISYWFPIWFLQNFPKEEIILTSYEAHIAEYWGRRVRDEIETNQFLENNILRHARAANDFRTKDNGGMKTAGIGGPITGRGAHLFIIDDIFKNWQEAMSETRRRHIREWFDSTAYTRLEPGGSIIVLMTRWHEYDLAGYLLSEHSDEWLSIVLPALAEENDVLGRQPGEALCPERFPVEQLLRIKKTSTRVWDGLYQQHPVSAEGEIWKRDWWRFYDELPPMHEHVMSWDMTFKDGKENDFVVGQVWGRAGNDAYLLHQVRGQWSFTRTLKEFEKLSLKYPEVGFKLIENKANGPAIEDTIRSKISGILLVEPKGGKIARAVSVEPMIESGHVLLPNPKKHPWINEFIEEAASFPKGKHDDQVDAASQSLIFIDERNKFSLDIF